MQSKLGYLLSFPIASRESKIVRLLSYTLQHINIESLRISSHDELPAKNFLASYQATSITN